MLWVLFAIAAIVIIAGWALMDRREDVGSIVCPFETKMGRSRARLTIARQADQADQARPMVHLRLRATGANLVFAMQGAQARELATLLESGATRLREP